MANKKPAAPFNADLKIAIIRSGKKQSLIARAARLDETQLSHIVRGRRRATEKEQARIARALGVDPSLLFPPVPTEIGA